MSGLDAVLIEAKKESLRELLSEPIDIVSEIEKLPGGNFILTIIKKHTDLGEHVFSEEEINKIKNSVENFFGSYSAGRVATILNYPKVQRELSNLLNEEFSQVDAFKSTKYVSFLLNAIDENMNMESWKRTDSLLWAAEELVKNITGKKRLPFEAEINLDYALYDWRVGDYNGGMEKTRDALKIARKLNDKKLIIRSYHLFGVLFRDFLKDKKPAIWFDEECLKMLEEEDDSLRQIKGSIYNNLGVAYHKMADMHKEMRNEYLKKAAESYEKGIEICSEIGYKKMEGWIYFNLAEVYAYLHEFEKAEKASIEAEEILGELNDLRGISGVLMSDAVIESKKENLKDALDYINKSIELRESLGEPRRVADALVFRGKLYQKMGGGEKAKEDFETALSIYEKIGSREDVIEEIRNYLTD